MFNQTCLCCGYVTLNEEQRICCLCGFLDSGQYDYKSNNIEDLCQSNILGMPSLYEEQYSHQHFLDHIATSLFKLRKMNECDYKDPKWVSVLEKLEQVDPTESDKVTKLNELAEKLYCSQAQALYTQQQLLYDIDLYSSDLRSGYIQALKLYSNALKKQNSDIWQALLRKYFNASKAYYLTWYAMLMGCDHEKQDIILKDIFETLHADEGCKYLLSGLLEKKIGTDWRQAVGLEAGVFENDFLSCLRGSIDWAMIKLAWQGKAPCGFENIDLSSIFNKSMIAGYAIKYLRTENPQDELYQSMTKLLLAPQLTDSEVLHLLKELCDWQFLDDNLALRKWDVVNVRVLANILPEEAEPDILLKYIANFWDRLYTNRDFKPFNSLATPMPTLDNLSEIYNAINDWLYQETEAIDCEEKRIAIYKVLEYIVFVLEKGESEWTPNFKNMQQLVVDTMFMNTATFAAGLEKLQASYVGILKVLGPLRDSYFLNQLADPITEDVVNKVLELNIELSQYIRKFEKLIDAQYAKENIEFYERLEQEFDIGETSE
jgi:hypothetical protein